MSIEKFFVNEKANAIFDPVPAYDGEWFFSIVNLKVNAKDDLFNNFYDETYKNNMLRIFKNTKILDIEPILKSTPSSDNYGRVLKYSKEHFFKSLLGILNQKIDYLGVSKEDYELSLNKIYEENIKKENAVLNLTIANIFRERVNHLQDVLNREINSPYFDFADADYDKYKNQYEFHEYVKENYEFSKNLYEGVLALGDFFDEPIDFNKLYNCFSADVFYLLFAKIIYDYNIEYLRNNNSINNSCKYLYFYMSMLELMLKEDNNYNVSITYNHLPYDIRGFISDYQKIVTKIPLKKIIILPNLTERERIKYANIKLMQKWERLFDDDILKNWEFIYKGEKIPKTSKNRNINLRINILENSGYMGNPMRGINMYKDYYAFVYANGEVILEYIGDNDLLPPTYVIKIDDFIKMSSNGNKPVREYVKDIPEDNMRRIFHTSLNNWQRVLYSEITDKEDNIDKIISEVERIKRGVLTDANIQ